jgi:hypothetical protein
MVKKPEITKDEQAVIDWLVERKFPTVDSVTEEQAEEFAQLWHKATSGEGEKAIHLYWLCEFAK